MAANFVFPRHAANAVEEEQATAENPLPTENEAQRVFDHFNMVKHSFVRLSLDPDWIDRRMSIDVNELLMVAVDGGNWHCKAAYTHNVVNGDGGLWTLSFNHRAD